MQDLQHLAIIWLGVFLASYLAKRTQLTSVLYFLAFGCLMGNMGILPQETTPFIEGFSKIGIILIMFALGFEENPTEFVRGMKRAWGIALFGAFAPFMTAYFVAMYFWGDVKVAIMCGLTMTATAVSLTMVSLRSEGLHRTDAARGIMTSTVLDDIASLALVAILLPLATGNSDISIVEVFLAFANAILYFGFVTILGLWLFPSESTIRITYLIPFARRYRHYFPFLERHGYGIPFLERYGLRDLLMMTESGQSTLTILLLALIISLMAQWFGFHPAVGAYMAGLILKQEYFHTDAGQQKQNYENCKQILDNVAFSWIGPVFFVNLGTKIILDADILFSVIPEMLMLTVGIIVVQILSGMLAARFTGHFAWHESVLIGIGELGRAELAFVVLDIGYVQNSILTTEAFYTLMLTAFWLNLSVPVLIKCWKPYFTGSKQLAFKIGSYRLVLSNSK